MRIVAPVPELISVTEDTTGATTRAEVITMVEGITISTQSMEDMAMRLMHLPFPPTQRRKLTTLTLLYPLQNHNQIAKLLKLNRLPAQLQK